MGGDLPLLVRRACEARNIECIIVVVDILLPSDDEMNSFQTLAVFLRCVCSRYGYD